MYSYTWNDAQEEKAPAPCRRIGDFLINVQIFYTIHQPVFNIFHLSPSLYIQYPNYMNVSQKYFSHFQRNLKNGSFTKLATFFFDVVTNQNVLTATLSSGHQSLIVRPLVRSVASYISGSLNIRSRPTGGLLPIVRETLLEACVVGQ